MKHNIALLKTILDRKDSLIFHNGAHNVAKLFYGEEFKDKMRGLFTISRSKRTKLVENGYLVWARVFSIENGDIDSESTYRARVLFSPANELSENTDILDKIAENVDEYILSLEAKKMTFKERRFYQAFTSVEEEPSYYPVPIELTGGKLCYMSVVYISPKRVTDSFSLPKLVPLLMNKTVSKEVLVVPQDLYSPEYLALIPNVHQV